MKLIAHITDENGIRKEQSLKGHCLQTAKYAAESVQYIGFSHTVFLAALMHDMGKAKQEYVDYIEAAYNGEPVRKGSVIHTFSGVIYLLERYHKKNSSVFEKMTCEIISYAIGAHHGMFDCIDLDGKNGFEHRLVKDRGELHYDETVQNYFSQVASEEEIETYFKAAVEEIRDFFNKVSAVCQRNGQMIFFQISMLVRLVLSAVIYGDRRDTSEFMRPGINSEVLEADWKRYENFFEQKIAGFAADSELNRVRGEISAQCRTFAENPPGIYRLYVPTGGGKTLCTLRYALAHARRYKKRRIIFIIPLLSVLDQNVKVIREYVPWPDHVLEHHSNVVKERFGSEDLDTFEFLTESWNAPVIVSTLVQLLDILFAQQTSAVGRMRALCDSVIVIDEVQSLPKRTTEIFNMALNFLRQFCNATIILSSATQPCFEELKWPLWLSEKPDMVRLDKSQMDVFQRVKITNCVTPYGMDFEEFAYFCQKRMDENVSLLIVCNTKAEARTLYEKLQRWESEEEGHELYHLSTAMCQRHRMNVLKDLQNGLSRIQQEFRGGKTGNKLICVSTQLIEAGVDLSFQCVVRVLAGLDNLAQAAGRCNRSSEYGQMGQVYLVNLKNENLNMLQEIRNAQNSTRKVLGFLEQSQEASCDSEEATRRFYRYLFQEICQETRYPVVDSCTGMKIYLADLLSNRIANDRKGRNADYLLHQPFQTVGKKFRVFDQETTDVLVPYGEGRALLECLLELREVYDQTIIGDILQQAKPYTVSLYAWQKQKLDDAGLLLPLLDGRMFAVKKNVYHDKYGLAEVQEQPVENFIF